MSDDDQVQTSIAKKFWNWVNATDLLYVVGGGALGGFLMPLVQRFLNSKSPFTNGVKIPEVWDTWFLAAVLGSICAGVVVYTLSYSDNNNRRQIFFISLLAGLTFPSFLSNTVDIRKTVEVQNAEIDSAENSADTVADSDSSEVQKLVAVEKSTESLKDALTEVKADTLDNEDREKVEADTKDVVEKLIKGANLKSGSADSDVTLTIADEVEKVLSTAKSQGYDVIKVGDKEEKEALDALNARAKVLRDQKNLGS